MPDAAPLQLVARTVFVVALVSAAVMDIRARRVPNLLCLALLVAGLAAATLDLVVPSVPMALLGAVVALAIWLPFWLLRMLGAGDVKFFACACAWLGPSVAWRASLAVALLGGAMASAAMMRQRGVRQAAEFGVFGATNAGAILRHAAEEPAAPPERRSFPYAVPMAMVLALAMFVPQWFD